MFCLVPRGSTPGVRLELVWTSSRSGLKVHRRCCALASPRAEGAVMTASSTLAGMLRRGRLAGGLPVTLLLFGLLLGVIGHTVLGSMGAIWSCWRALGYSIEAAVVFRPRHHS